MKCAIQCKIQDSDVGVRERRAGPEESAKVGFRMKNQDLVTSHQTLFLDIIKTGFGKLVLGRRVSRYTRMSCRCCRFSYFRV